MPQGTIASELKRDQPTILCIDEGQLALADRTALLESAGYRVFPAATANAAMQLFVSHEIDLVVTNNHLSGVSGAELSIFMKQVKPVQVVLLSNGVPILSSLLSHVEVYMEQDYATGDLLRCLERVAQKIVRESRTGLYVDGGLAEYVEPGSICYDAGPGTDGSV